MHTFTAPRFTPGNAHTFGPSTRLRDLTPSKSSHPLSLKQLIILARTLATTIKAGLPILRALSLAEHHLPKPSRPLIAGIRSQVANGSSLADALRAHPDTFNHLFVSMVEIGERSGTLAESLARISSTLEATRTIRSTVVTALLYPVLVCGITFLVTIALLIFVVPAFRDLFAEYGVPLPFLTQAILSISDALVTHSSLILTLSVLALGVLGAILSSPRNRSNLRNSLELIPVLGSIPRTATLIRITQTLGTMIAAGIPAAEGLTVCAESCAALSLRTKLLAAADAISNGKPLADSLTSTDLFPTLMIEMVRLGEESGTLDSALTATTHWYDEEMRITTRRLSQLIEPILMITLGIVVGGIVLAMYLPIFEMGNVMTR